jgi:hypothetical protein
VHEALLAQPPAVIARQAFIDHDRLCADPAAWADGLAGLVQLDAPLDLTALRPAPRRTVAIGDPELFAHAHDVHCRLGERFREAFA